MFNRITRATALTPEFHEAMAHLLPQLAPDATLPSPAAWAEILAQPSTYVLLAHGDNGVGIVGTLTLVLYRTLSGLHAWVEDVVVDQNARGQGIGEALCRAALNIAQEAGASGVSLTSRPSRAAANRLYLRLGFVQRQTNVYLFQF